MTIKSKRTWIPTRAYVGRTTIRTQVARWEWTRRSGLLVIYLDGTAWLSDYGNLRTFLAAIRDGREHAREVTK